MELIIAIESVLVLFMGIYIFINSSDTEFWKESWSESVDSHVKSIKRIHELENAICDIGYEIKEIGSITLTKKK